MFVLLLKDSRKKKTTFMQAKLNIRIGFKNVFNAAVILLVCFTVTANAQTVSPNVFSSAGAFTTSSTNSLSYTIGEPMITTLSSSSVILTQGFQQPSLLNVDAVNYINGEKYDIVVYPNPTEGFINVSIKAINGKDISLQVFDVLGRNIYTTGNVLSNGEYLTILDFTSFTQGIYFLSVYSEGQKIASTKITKSK